MSNENIRISGMESYLYDGGNLCSPTTSQSVCPPHVFTEAFGQSSNIPISSFDGNRSYSNFTNYGGGSNIINSNSNIIISEIENSIIKSNTPIPILEHETITVNGQSGIWANKQESVNWRGPIPLESYEIYHDSNPEVIRKNATQKVVYEQEIAIRYLKPPPLPVPGDLTIIQENNTVLPPAPPLIIRQQAARAETPEPLIIREAPPRPPSPIQERTITLAGKRLPAPPRKVIVEKLAPLPGKPQAVIIERWLPYEQQKRRVIYKKSSEAAAVVEKPRNLVIEWQEPEVSIKKVFKDLGVIRANPTEYLQKYGTTLKAYHDLPSFVKEIPAPTGVTLAADVTTIKTVELEGDVHALSLVDIEREGLTEYRSYIAKYASIFSNSGSTKYSKTYSSN